MLDHQDAPGVGTPVENGLRQPELQKVLQCLAHNKNFSGLEIVEFNPLEDIAQQTESVIVDLIKAVFG